MNSSNSLSVLSDIVSKYRSQTKHGELEVRIGRFKNGKFMPGIERSEFDQLVSDFQSSSSLQGDETWTEVLDYYYTCRNVKTRTRVLFDSESMDVRAEHINKVTQSECVMNHVNDGEDIAFKLSFSIETPITDPPNVCIPTYVRIKQRRRFKDIREGKLIWCYELSKTWSANSRSAVEHAQHMSPPIYEVECELVDEERTYMKERCDEKVAMSFLMKSQLLLGEGSEDFMFVPVNREESGYKRKRSSK